jgi:hypothetical protein
MSPVWSDRPGAMMVGVFERFEDGSRRVLVVAQEEARLGASGHIGTEHILLGLMSGGVAADVLSAAGQTLDSLRQQVARTVELRSAPQGPAGSAPFTPRAKKVLELALHEALDRQSATIGPGDLLLGLLQEGEGVGVQVLRARGVDLDALRRDVLSRLADLPAGSTTTARFGRRTVGAPVLAGRPVGGRQFESCILCGRDSWEVDHYVTDGNVMVCQVCIEDAAAAMDEAGEETRLVRLPPRVFGKEPTPGAAASIARSIAAMVGPEPDEGWDAYLEDAAEVRPFVLQARQRTPLGGAQGIVRRLRFLSPTTAWVYLAVHLGPGSSGFPFEGPVRLIDGSWKVTRELQAKMLGAAGVELPPKP